MKAALREEADETMDLLAACRHALDVGVRIRRGACAAVRAVRKACAARALRRTYLRAEEGMSSWDEYARVRKHYWWKWEKGGELCG